MAGRRRGRRPEQLRRAVGRERRGSDAQLVWIMGSPRTGSTWLVNLLAFVTGSPMIDEPLIGVHLATPVSAITARPGEGTDGLVSEMFADRPDYFFSDAHADVWIPALRELVVRRLFADLPPERDQRLVLVKEPNGSLAAPMSMRCLPRSRLLFLVRDGRDVVDSVLDGLDGGWMGESFGLDVAGYGGRAGVLASRAQRWVDDTAAVQQAYDARPANLRMMLRYEDLLAEPVDRLVDVLAWLAGRHRARRGRRRRRSTRPRPRPVRPAGQGEVRPCGDAWTLVGTLRRQRAGDARSDHGTDAAEPRLPLTTDGWG